MNDYWDLQEIIASQTEVKTTDDTLPFYIVSTLLDRSLTQISLPTFYQLDEFKSSSLVNLHSLNPSFFTFTKLLLQKVQSSIQDTIVKMARERLTYIYDVNKFILNQLDLFEQELYAERKRQVLEFEAWFFKK
jgi:hypothetical protein